MAECREPPTRRSSQMSEDRTPAETTDATTDAVEVATADLLVEEVSIDGMCGVY